MTVFTVSTMLAFLAFSTPFAGAQDCGSWSQPVVCEARLVLNGANYRDETLGGRSTVELGPREQVELLVDARDQRGRRFPLDRLAVDYDAGRCGSILSIQERGEGELRIIASAPEGRCSMEIYLPNNLNFFWEIEFEISAAARARYDRAEAQMLGSALYLAILGREADPGGLASATAEIQSGDLERQIDGMLGSAEFRQSSAGKTAAELLEQFYQGILGRAGDSAGVRLYQGEMRRGDYASVLLKLIRSPEFERRLG